jgi:hypothetical protein
LKDVPRGSILEVVGGYLETVLRSTNGRANGSTNGSNVLHVVTGGTCALALGLVHQNETDIFNAIEFINLVQATIEVCAIQVKFHPFFMPSHPKSLLYLFYYYTLFYGNKSTHTHIL